MNIKDKIYSGFEAEFWKIDARDLLKIEIIDNLAKVIFKSGLTYWCLLTSKGIKKNSWRIEN